MPPLNSLFREVGLSGRLIVALICAEAYCRKHSFSSPALDRLFSNLWTWPSIDSQSFDVWYKDYLEAAIWAVDEELPSELAHRAGTRAPELCSLLMNTAEIVAGSLFAAADIHGSLVHLTRVLDIARDSGVSIPEPSLVASVSVHEERGWGRRLLPPELIMLRKQGAA